MTRRGFFRAVLALHAAPAVLAFAARPPVSRIVSLGAGWESTGRAADLYAAKIRMLSLPIGVFPATPPRYVFGGPR